MGQNFPVLIKGLVLQVHYTLFTFNQPLLWRRRHSGKCFSMARSVCQLLDPFITLPDCWSVWHIVLGSRSGPPPHRSLGQNIPVLIKGLVLQVHYALFLASTNLFSGEEDIQETVCPWHGPFVGLSVRVLKGAPWWFIGGSGIVGSLVYCIPQECHTY